MTQTTTLELADHLRAHVSDLYGVNPDTIVVPGVFDVLPRGCAGYEAYSFSVDLDGREYNVTVEDVTQIEGQ